MLLSGVGLRDLQQQPTVLANVFMKADVFIADVNNSSATAVLCEFLTHDDI